MAGIPNLFSLARQAPGACVRMNAMRSSSAFSRRVATSLFVACVACVPPAAGRAAAQNRPASTAGAPRSIVLPRKLVSGAPATLSVLDAAGRLLPGVVLETTGGEKLRTDATGRAKFTAPAVPGKLVVHVEGQMIAASAPVVPASGSESAATSGVQLASSPHVLEVRNRFELAGTGFRGIADENHIAIGEKQALVLAASPTSIVALPDPDTPLGAAVLSAGIANQTPATAAVIVVTLEPIGPQGKLRAGQQATFTVRVRGTTEPLRIEISDLSPAILQLPNGNPLGMTTSGGAMNEAKFEVVLLAAGRYSVGAHLAPNQ